jgi:uncharacterized protein
VRIAALVAVLLLTGCGPTAETGTGPTAEPDMGPTVTVGEAATLQVEVADTPDERRVGLMGRTEVPPGTGMAFVYPAPTRGAFWMADTLVPLSIAWVHEGSVVGVAEMVPCTTVPADCPLYYPDDPNAVFDLAVEAPAGTFTRAGVRPGDPVVVSGF